MATTTSRTKKVLSRDIGSGESFEWVSSNNGIKDTADFCKLMDAIISDVLSNRMNPRTANSVVSASGRILKAVELKHKWGGGKHLSLR